MVKVRMFFGTVVLIAAAALGFHYFGRGSQTDTSKDRSVQLYVRFERQSPIANASYAVYLNDLEREYEGLQSSWTDTMWLRPGEKIRLEGIIISGVGRVTCRITDGDKVIEHIRSGDAFRAPISCVTEVVW